MGSVYCLDQWNCIFQEGGCNRKDDMSMAGERTEMKKKQIESGI